MRTPDELPLDPEIAAELEAIDATLAGEPVDPAYAEVAELALLLTAERPRPRAEFAAELDAHLERRFRRAPGESAPGARGGSRDRPRSRWPRRLSLWPAAGGAATALAALIAAIVVLAGGSGPSRPPAALEGLRAGASSSAASPTAAPGASAGAIRAPGPANGAVATTPSAPIPAPGRPAARHGAPSTAHAPAFGSLTPLAKPNGGAAGARSLSLPQNGRKAIQSAQLALVTAPSRIDTVAQEAFDVIGAEQGIVRHSTVTATGGSDGYAELRLSVPSGNLADLMNRLSQLRYAHVGSRTDSSQDVNDRYVVLVRRLGDERALRTSLLKQLAAAVTQQQIDSLKAQLRDDEARISADENTLASLNKQVNLSDVELTISAGAVPVVPPSHGSGGFTLGRAAHDAGRVLTVAAGVALIALAALVPVGLVAALSAWILMLLRRRRREQALDAV